MSGSLDDIAEQLKAGEQLLSRKLYIQLGDCRLALACNSEALIETLENYFRHVLTSPDIASADIEVVAIARAVADTGLPFRDWPREPGKTGRKDAYLDLPPGRVLLKVRTGMLFIQSDRVRLAAGPCHEHDNQLVNFILSQYMNWLQQRNWLICHAAALAGPHGATGLAGFSGGGKSTLMLQLLERPEHQFLTNDRLFIRLSGAQTEARGIPKLPRINPGTIVHNPRLQSLIPAAERSELGAMPPAELWQLEDKYDVPVASLYGAGRIRHAAFLARLVVLNWQRDSAMATRLQQVDPAQRPDLLEAIMKSPGPFYQDSGGQFLHDSSTPPMERYLDALGGIPVFELGGRTDFGRAVQLIDQLAAD